MGKLICGFLILLLCAFLAYDQYKFDIKTQQENFIKSELIAKEIRDFQKKENQILKSKNTTSSFQEICICKAVIGTVMGKDPSIMNGRMINNLPHVYYNRPNDGTLWKYKCKIEGGTVLWAMDPGRWRYEDFISYEIHSSSITVYDGSSDIKRTYPFQ